ncbi:MAG: hypothetical protein JO324_07445 [Candidatus Eremiobacteraeota bacterium]|nr:hypothetical protein [Candidatus Eremiobacteraeota bacterium]
MERDDLREAWASLQPDAPTQAAVERALARRSLARGMQTALDRERRRTLFEIAGNYVAVIALGAFAADHAHRSADVVGAAILAVALIVLNVALIGLAVALNGIDYEMPLLPLQTSIETIRARRAKLTATVLALAPLAWAPLLVVLVSLAGGDAIALLGRAYIAANAAFGAAVAFAAWLLARRYRGRVRSPWLSWASNALSGQAYREALERLASLERFREIA